MPYVQNPDGGLPVWVSDNLQTPTPKPADTPWYLSQMQAAQPPSMVGPGGLDNPSLGPFSTATSAPRIPTMYGAPQPGAGNAYSPHPGLKSVYGPSWGSNGGDNTAPTGPTNDRFPMPVPRHSPMQAALTNPGNPPTPPSRPSGFGTNSNPLGIPGWSSFAQDFANPANPSGAPAGAPAGSNLAQGPGAPGSGLGGFLRNTFGGNSGPQGSALGSTGGPNPATIFSGDPQSGLPSFLKGTKLGNFLQMLHLGGL
jgi:hypothetical protein